MAKNVVNAGLAKRCCIQISYAIGVAEPLSVHVETYGTESAEPHAIEKAIRAAMDLRPRGIRTHLQLNRPIFQKTAAYGHFGRDPDSSGGFTWEKTDLADRLLAAI